MVRSSSDHEHQIAKLASQGRDFDVVEQERLDDRPTRKAVYLPKREWEREEGDDGTDVTIRQELIEDFEGVGDTTPLSEGRNGDSPLSNLLDEVAEEEEIEEPARVEATTMPFETNFPVGGRQPRGRPRDETPDWTADSALQASLWRRERISEAEDVPRGDAKP